ncbi:MAG: M48 family metallopeptidase [Selenomonadaceae bacterium]|nr:M48 family metallopeptidase [Selenomonadaceae bacterium]
MTAVKGKAAFTLNLEEIRVEGERKPIKNIHLRIKPPEGRVVVSAPWHMPQSAVEDFVRRNLDWIRENLRQIKARPPVPRRKYETGETLFLWGKAYRLRIIAATGERSLLFRNGEAVLCVEPGSDRETREKYVLECYREILKKAIPPVLDRWEKLTGLNAAEWRTKTMKTRWGTCNTRARRLWFNVELAEKPPVCLEYVVLHELMHLVERYHNAHFAALLDRYMPHWREVKQTLNGQKYTG